MSEATGFHRSCFQMFPHCHKVFKKLYCIYQHGFSAALKISSGMAQCDVFTDPNMYVYTRENSLEQWVPKTEDENYCHTVEYRVNYQTKL